MTMTPSPYSSLTHDWLGGGPYSSLVVRHSSLRMMFRLVRLLRLGDDLLLKISRHFLVVGVFHVERSASLSDGAESRAVGEHLGHRNSRLDHLRVTFRIDAVHSSAA